MFQARPPRDAPTRASGYPYGYCRIAFVVWDPVACQLFHAETVAPDDMLRYFHQLRARKTYICQGELVGIAGPYFCEALRHVFRGARVLHAADNKAANSGVIGAYSSVPDCAQLISGIHLQWARLGVIPWVEWVASEANLADLPSRGLFDLLRGLGSIRVRFDLPPYDDWGSLEPAS